MRSVSISSKVLNDCRKGKFRTKNLFLVGYRRVDLLVTKMIKTKNCGKTFVITNLSKEEKKLLCWIKSDILRNALVVGK